MQSQGPWNRGSGRHPRQLIGLLLLALLFFPALQASAQHSEGSSQAATPAKTCLDCHGDRTALEAALTDKGRPVEQFLVDGPLLKETVHAALDCTDCHGDFEDFPHSQETETVSCAECHEEASEAFSKSIHSQSIEGKDNLPVSCQACHGVHNVFKATERRSTLHPLNVHQVCGSCHFSVDPATASVDMLLQDTYTDDAHGHGILRAGLVVSATCVSCHGGHEIRSQGHPDSKVARIRVHEACGQCHVKAVEDYSSSVHFLHLNGNGAKGATCSDCHPSHTMKEADADFRLQSIKTCSGCHDERTGTFRKTYHGKVSSLGFGGEVATCEHCHGSHLILPRADPRSKIHPTQLLNTCQSCHEDANEEFVNYLVHADPKDGDQFPTLNLVYVLMVGLVTVVITLGTFHILLWLIRSLAAREWRHPRSWNRGGRFLKHRSFFLVRIETVTSLSTLLLASTGIPLYFSEEPWADNLMRFIGGPSTAAFVHRAAAVALMGAFMLFFGHILVRWLVRKQKGLFRGPDSMTPSMQDLRDFVGNIRWFLGLGPKPEFDRFSYWERMDFWAVLWGMGIMGVSGLMLWFPAQATLLVPAWVVNAAGVIHGLEALLATVFHFSVQSFQHHLRPDKFPLDLSVFTGLIEEDELRVERPLEYERLRSEGRLENMVVSAPGPGFRKLTIGFGLVTEIAGLMLLAGIIFAFLG